MLNMRIENKGLGELVSAVEDASFFRARRLLVNHGTLDATEWQVYERVTPNSGVRDVAYLSDTCELLVASTFANGDEPFAGRGHQDTLTEILRNYTSAEEEIRWREKGGNLATGVAALIGAFVGARGGVVGFLGATAVAGGATYIVTRLATGSVTDKLEKYLSHRNVLLGESALDYMYRSKEVENE